MPAPNLPTGFAVSEAAVLQFCPPRKISNLAAALLTWTDTNSGAASHRIEKSTDAGTTWLPTLSYDGPRGAGVTDVGKTTLLIGGLAIATAHLFRVRAEADGTSAWTASIAHTTGPLSSANADATLSAPTSLAVSSVTNRRVTATWEDNSSSEASFELQMSIAGQTETILVPGTFESVTVEVADLFRYDVAAKAATLRVRARGGKAAADKRPPFVSSWSNEVAFAMGAPNIRITNYPRFSGEQGLAVALAITTNTPATSFSSTGALPAGVTLNTANGLVSGTPTAAGTFSVVFTATDGTTSDSATIIFTIAKPQLVITSAGEVTAPLGNAFSYTIVGRNVLPGGVAPSGFAAANLPPWLSISGPFLSGSPVDPGVYVVQLTISAGTGISAGKTLTITVPPATVIAATIPACVGQALAYSLTTAPLGAEVTISDGPAWLTIDGLTLRGVPDVVGNVSVDVTATIGDQAGSATIEIVVGPLFSFGADEVGYKGGFFYSAIKYNGAGSVHEWQIAGGPDGLAIVTEILGAPYTTSVLTAFKGTPTRAGRFDATVSVSVRMPDGSVAVFRQAVTFYINGDLFLNWLHIDPSLYDLQMQIRGDATDRVVRSWYGSAAVAAKTTVETVTAGAVTDVTTSVQPASAAHLLTVKRGDTVKLAIVIRDGEIILGTAAVTPVRFTLREVEAIDGDYIFDQAATATVVGAGRTYYLVTLSPATTERINDLLNGESLGELRLLGEISATYTIGGATAFSSGTCEVLFVEDVKR